MKITSSICILTVGLFVAVVVGLLTIMAGRVESKEGISNISAKKKRKPFEQKTNESVRQTKKQFDTFFKIQLANSNSWLKTLTKADLKIVHDKFLKINTMAPGAKKTKLLEAAHVFIANQLNPKYGNTLLH